MLSRSLIVPVAWIATLAAAATAQTRAEFATFGKGCSSNPIPPSLYSPKLPVIGREFAVAANGLPKSTIAAFVFGASNSAWAGVRLPFNLGPIGAPNCNLLVSPDGGVGAPTGIGFATIATRLPRDNSLVGRVVYAQVWAPDPRANRAGLALSNAGRILIGNYLGLREETVTETFQNDSMLDKEAAGGIWGGGKAVATALGGTGVLGVFDYRLGTRRADGAYVFDSNRIVIPATHTETGKQITVTNGVLEFSTMHVPKNVTVVFTGSNFVMIHVRGSVKIEGRVDVGAPDAAFYVAGGPVGGTAKGQPGGAGGAGGGRGGKGADQCLNRGAGTAYDGSAGSDVGLLSGHAYGTQARGTGGKGSLHWPRSGRTSSYCMLTGVFNGEMTNGAGGGGFITPGAAGKAVRTACGTISNLQAAGGKGFDIGLLQPRTSGPFRSLAHYAVGGSGGGGSGSHPLLTRRSPFDKWLPGVGGSGGGGVLAFRVGRDLTVTSTGELRSRGGEGYVYDGVLRLGETGDNLFNCPAPAGGGSGGSVLLQVAGSASLAGQIDCGGGKGGRLDNRPTKQAGLLAISYGGDGAPGYIRLEEPVAPPVSVLGRTVPAARAANVGGLVDYDPKTKTQSMVYNTGLSFSPLFVRYEIVATVGGRQRVYSDDPGFKHPNFAGAASSGPVVIRVQGAQIDQKTNQVTRLFPWRDNVRRGTRNALAQDDANGFRFQIQFDRTTPQVIEIHSVRLVYQR